MAIGKEQIPSWLCKYIDQEDLPEIALAISQAEAKTSAEIVPMVVSSSSSVGHVPMALALFLFAILLLADLNLHWESLSEWGVFITPLAALAIYGLSLLLSKFWFVQRILTPNSDEARHVALRAEIEFHRLNMEATEKRTGILIFVSMMERRVVVLADKGISSVLPAGTWENLVRTLVLRLKQKDLKTGFQEAILTCGDLLSVKLPSSSTKTNEIANELVIKA